MNIFYLDRDPTECARYHADKHCVKMILEYAQLLSTAHRVLDGKESIVVSKSGRKQKVWALSGDIEYKLYKATHINHPSAIWVRQSDKNYHWLVHLLLCLCEEYTHRYGKVHKVQRDALTTWLCKLPDNIPSGKFTQPTPAMPDIYKVVDDSIKSYHNYYNGEKQHLFKWKSREVPYFIKMESL